DANLTEIPDQVSCPAVNVSLLNCLAHPLHAGTSFFRFHLQSITDGISGAFDIIWVHQHRIPQFPSSSGKTAEDQDSLLIIAGRDKFLGYQVHSIMQGRDQANVCTPVVTFNFAVAVVPVQKDNRLPLASPKAPVDSFGFGLYLGKEVVIT